MVTQAATYCTNHTNKWDKKRVQEKHGLLFQLREQYVPNSKGAELSWAQFQLHSGLLLIEPSKGTIQEPSEEESQRAIPSWFEMNNLKIPLISHK